MNVSLRIALLFALPILSSPASAAYCIFKLNPSTKIVERSCNGMTGSPNKEETAALRKGLAKECVIEWGGAGTQPTLRRYCR
jgi:hypothetical protein